MSNMELDKRLEENKYELWEACQILADLGLFENGRVVERIAPSSNDILFAEKIRSKIEGKDVNNQ